MRKPIKTYVTEINGEMVEVKVYPGRKSKSKPWMRKRT